MAEPTQSPALPSTADAVPYVPVSWTAVAAVIVAGNFALLLLILGYFAFTNKKPLLTEELLVMPVIAVVLSFAARRIIRNSEGTRTGESLAVGAWWTALVFGLGYVAYLGAISFSVRRDAANEVKQWVDLVQDDKPERAFYKTLHPGARQGITRDDTFELQRRFRDDLLAFRNSDLMKLAQRNKGDGEFTFVSGGVADWKYQPGTIDCTFTGTVKCPEGNFPILIPLKGVEGVSASEGGGGRQWAIAWRTGSGFVQQDKVERTNYGWLVLLLEIDGAAFGKAFVEHVNFGPTGHPYLYHAFIAENGDPSWIGVVRTPLTHLFFAAPMGVLHPGGYTEYLANNFFRLPGNGKPEPGQTNKFLAAWNAQGVFEAGRRLKDPSGGIPDKENVLKITDTAIEIHVPIEIPIQNATGKPETARGRVVIACKDPALLAELKERKSAAKNETPSISPPTNMTRDKPLSWRVVRIESDLTPVNIQQQPGQGPPGGGPGGHGAGGH